MQKVTVLLLLGLALLVAGLGFWYLQQNRVAEPETQAIDAPGATTTEQLPGPAAASRETGSENSVTDPGSEQNIARWRKYSDSSLDWAEVKSPADDGKPRPAADSELKLLDADVEAALAGDNQALDRIMDRADNCRYITTVTPEDVENEITFMINRREQRTGQQINRNDVEVQERVAERRDSMLSHLKNCSWRYSRDFPTLREQIGAQAEAGNVLARFIYALMLKPSPLEADYLIEVARWADNSLRYTTANIQQNLTVGYLAQAHSYSTGIFTPRDSRLAGIWAYMVMTCPSAGPIPLEQMNELLSTARLEYLTPTTLAWGAELANTICLPGL